MSMNTCSNWFDSFVCNSKCCTDTNGFRGCCYLDPTILENHSVDSFTTCFLVISLVLLLLLIACIFIERSISNEAVYFSPIQSSFSAASSTSTLITDRERDRDEKPANFNEDVYSGLLDGRSSIPEILLVEKDVNGDEVYTMLREYAQTDRILDLYTSQAYNLNRQVSPPPSY